jgi:primosomal protein N'
MKINKIISQHRRDFYADMICEHCGHIEEKVSCYDDAYFHKEVIPNMVCKKCGEKAPDDYRPLTTKYPDGQVV